MLMLIKNHGKNSIWDVPVLVEIQNVGKRCPNKGDLCMVIN